MPRTRRVANTASSPVFGHGPHSTYLHVAQQTVARVSARRTSDSRRLPYFFGGPHWQYYSRWLEQHIVSSLWNARSEDPSSSIAKLRHIFVGTIGESSLAYTDERSKSDVRYVHTPMDKAKDRNEDGCRMQRAALNRES